MLTVVRVRATSGSDVSSKFTFAVVHSISERAATLWQAGTRSAREIPV